MNIYGSYRPPNEGKPSLFIYLVILLIPSLQILSPDWGWANPHPTKDITDKDITIAIESRFLVDRSVPRNFIDVNTENGIVTLSGKVDNLLARDRAKNIVGSIRGVRAIINLLEVEPLIPINDENLKARVETALAADPATDAYKISVKVKKGGVTLKGTVDSWQEKSLSLEVVKSIKGVKEVDSELKITPTPLRPDSEIKAEIIRRLQSDVWVRANLIGIIVEHGRVTMTGTIGSLSEKELAYRDAWVRGVKKVNVSQLNVKEFARDRMLRSPIGLVQSSAQKADAIRLAHSYDPRVQNFDIAVVVENGTAILTGIVNNVAAKIAAEQTARNTVGIWRVRNFIKVRGIDHPKDEELEKRVREALDRSPLVDRYELKISSRNGTVTLVGYVDSTAEMTQAVQTIARVKGVTNVVNHLERVDLDPGNSDEEIWHEIRQSFWWEPQLYDHEIRVIVADGIVTLKGTVPSIAVWRRATEIVKESRARGVRNQLKVEYGPDFLSAKAPLLIS